MIRSRLGWSCGSAIIPLPSSSSSSSPLFSPSSLALSFSFSSSSSFPYFSIRKKDQSAEPFLPLLPIPLFRARLLESLGAVTMCCFIDDDIICEGYSGIDCVMIYLYMLSFIQSCSHSIDNVTFEPLLYFTQILYHAFIFHHSL